MAHSFLLLTVSLLAVLPCRAAGLFSDRFQVLESGIPGGWAGAGAGGARPDPATAVGLIQGAGPAKVSADMEDEGEEADIHVPGVALKKLHEYAVSLKAGGVGYYPSSGFVHVDVGRVRYW